MNSHKPSTAWWITAAFLFATLSAFSISGPELTVRGVRGEKSRLAIESIETDIFFYQDLAETIITVTFKNPERRITEGEFAIPLPPGATVSSYALDVHGEMRDGVVVEKERARNAYESIKRQMIDPGFVEREAGNVYRTKIFPIPSRGTKAVRIGYCEILSSKNNKTHYRLPLPEKIKIGHFQAKIVHGENKTFEITSLGDFSYPKTSVIDAEFSAQNITLGKELAINFEAPKSTILATGETYSYLRHPLSKAVQKPIPRKLKDLEIYWDCSESGRLRNHQKELSLLEAFFQKHPNIKVTLSLFHYTKESGDSFEVKNGDWKKLRSALSSVLYDGATNFSVITPRADLTLVFSDGINSSLAPLSLSKNPCLLISSTGKTSPEWQSFVSRNDGEIIDLKSTSIPDAVKKISRHPLTILSDESALIDNNSIRLFQANKQVTGLKFQRSSSGSEEIAIPIRRIENPRSASIVHKLWAQQKLLDLEAEALPNRTAIISHCKEHGLVSNETSLIVLDRFEDYVRYQIPPPEEALQEKYAAALKKSKVRTSSSLDNRWYRRTLWHSTNFPWQDHVLLAPIKRISIWQKSLRKAFDLKDLDQDSIGTIARWKIKALEIQKSKSSITDASSYQKWLNDLSALQKQEQGHPQIAHKSPKENEKIAVSLRGFVNTPGTYHLDSKLTLKQALQQAGGLHSLGTASGVAIYRNASKTIYNTLSKEFRDVPIMNGDMLVVLQDGWDSYYGDADPFGESSSPPSPRERPAIIKESPRSIATFLGGSGDGGGAPAISHKMEGSLILAKTKTTIPSALVAFEKDLAQGLPAIDTYSKLREAARYDDAFYIKASQLLHKNGHPDLAHRVLSNLVEESKPRPASFRKWAFALAHINEHKRARSVLKNAIRLYPQDPLLLMDLAWLERKIDPNKLTSSHPSKIIFDQDRSLGEISAAYLYGKTKDQTEIAKIVNKRALPVDLRIVVTNTSGQRGNYQIIDPAGIRNFTRIWGSSASQVGGRMIGEKGLSEFMIKNAMPGDYQLSFRSKEPEILRVEIYRNWNRSNQSSQEHLLLFNGSPSPQDVFTYTLSLKK